jgi:hypothetical protein
LIDMRSKINSTSDEGIKLDKVDGNIHFNHVTFKYPSRPDVQVFSDFTLGIPSRKVNLTRHDLHPYYYIKISIVVHCKKGRKVLLYLVCCLGMKIRARCIVIPHRMFRKRPSATLNFFISR